MIAVILHLSTTARGLLHGFSDAASSIQLARRRDKQLLVQPSVDNFPGISSWQGLMGLPAEQRMSRRFTGTVSPRP
jgi:hypothetical protein